MKHAAEQIHFVAGARVPTKGVRRTAGSCA